MNSEAYIREKVRKRSDESTAYTYYIYPDIPDKKLTNAAYSIADGIDPTTVTAIYDITVFGSAKDGIVFTGTNIYLKDSFQSTFIVPLQNIVNVNYEEHKETDSNGNYKTRHTIKVYYSDDDAPLEIDDSVFSHELEFLSELLSGLAESVEKIEETKSIDVNDIGEDIKTAYISVVASYLKTDDGFIDAKEYKELLGLMTVLKLKKATANSLREQRLMGDVTADYLSLIDELEKMLERENLEKENIYHSLFSNLLLTRKDKIDNWDKDEDLAKIKDRLGINDSQIEFFITKIKADDRILDERLDNNQVNEISKELMAVAGGAGVSVAAFALMGGVGLFGFVVLGAAGYGIYQGIKYFSGTSETEKYGIRIAALENSILQNKAVTTYMVEDINWLSGKISEISRQIEEERRTNGELIDSLMDQLMQQMDRIGLVSESTQIIADNDVKYSYEINISKLPLKLDEGKFEQLVKSNRQQAVIREYVYSFYKKDEYGEYSREEEFDGEDAEKLYNMMKSIGYFDTKTAAVAKAQAVGKKGLDAVKSFLNF